MEVKWFMNYLKLHSWNDNVYASFNRDFLFYVQRTCSRMVAVSVFDEKNYEPIDATKCLYLELVFRTPKDMHVFGGASNVLFLALKQTHCKKMSRF